MRDAASQRARPYVLAVLCVGCIILTASVATLWTTPPPAQWWVLVALTLLSGSAVLKIPSVPVNFSISDVFTLTSAVLFGPAAGMVTVAIDSLAISARLARSKLPLERVLFNAAAPPVAMWLSATAFFRASGIHAVYGGQFAPEVVTPWLLLFAALYFFLNTFAIAVAIALHERANAFSIWRAHFQNLWLTFIGGGLGAASVVFALQLGRYGLVILSLPLLLAVILHFAYQNATGRVADQLRHLAEVNRLHLSTIEALAHAIDAKDAVTHGHIRRVQGWAVALAGRLGVDDTQQLRAIEAAALLHDIGKLAVPEHILNKPGKLTAAEFERMKSHARVGAEILSEVEFPYPVVPIVRHHHENWDGTGYPDGLSGGDIPIGARILAVVDCFDALTSDRPYRRALSAEQAFAIIESRRGTMYDPAIVTTFREICAPTLRQDRGPAAIPQALAQTPAAAPLASVDEGADAGGDAIRVAMRIASALTRACDARCPFWRVLAEVVRDLPGVDTAAVFALDDATQCLRPVAVSGAHARTIEPLSIRAGERMSGWVAAAGQPILNADPALDLVDASRHALESAMAIPCCGPGGSRGVVALYSTRANAFTALHQRVLEYAAAFGTAEEFVPRASGPIPDGRRASSPSGRMLHEDSELLPAPVHGVRLAARRGGTTRRIS